jgi:hypothetical protein
MAGLTSDQVDRLVIDVYAHGTIDLKAVRQQSIVPPTDFFGRMSDYGTHLERV